MNSERVSIFDSSQFRTYWNNQPFQGALILGGLFLGGFAVGGITVYSAHELFFKNSPNQTIPTPFPTPTSPACPTEWPTTTPFTCPSCPSQIACETPTPASTYTPLPAIACTPVPEWYDANIHLRFGEIFDNQNLVAKVDNQGHFSISGKYPDYATANEVCGQQQLTFTFGQQTCETASKTPNLPPDKTPFSPTDEVPPTRVATQGAPGGTDNQSTFSLSELLFNILKRLGFIK